MIARVPERAPQDAPELQEPRSSSSLPRCWLCGASKEPVITHRRDGTNARICAWCGHEEVWYD